MKRILITGVCGFVGSEVARCLLEQEEGISIVGLDNFIRPGSEQNRLRLTEMGVRVLHGDLRCAADLEALPKVDWVIDAAANPSVLAGMDGQSSSRQLVEHNLIGTINLLEFCKKHQAGFVLLSTSRVYSIPPLASLAVEVQGKRFVPIEKNLPAGLSRAGVGEDFTTAPPVSLYGSTKVASEVLALEYGLSFDLPVWVNRCGVLAGAGQFGRPDQGIFAFWIHSWRWNYPLKYIGFEGSGAQLRDLFHPSDLTRMVRKQMAKSGVSGRRIYNLGGGAHNAFSLAELSHWCSERFTPREVAADPQARMFDIPWMVMDASRAKADFDWCPERSGQSILEELAVHAEANPDWLKLSAPPRPSVS